MDRIASKFTRKSSKMMHEQLKESGTELTDDKELFCGILRGLYEECRSVYAK